MPGVISKISRIEHAPNHHPTLAGVLGKVYRIQPQLARWKRCCGGGHALYVEGLIDQKSGGASIAEWQKIRRFFHTKHLHFLKTPA